MIHHIMKELVTSYYEGKYTNTNSFSLVKKWNVGDLTPISNEEKIMYISSGNYHFTNRFCRIE